MEFDVEQIEPGGVIWLKTTYLMYKEKGKSAAGQMKTTANKQTPQSMTIPISIEGIIRVDSME